MVRPRGCTDAVTSGTSSSEEWPPETSSAIVGSGSGPCSSTSTATWAARWLTPCSRTPRATASALAAATPTVSAPASPGPDVTATASTSDSRTPACAQARSIVGTIASRWARLATSGTTPPNRACSSTELATASASSRSPRTRPIPVSSHDVSIPSTSGSSAILVALPRSRQRTAPHDPGVHVARLVVAAAHRDALEALTLVEGDRGGVVGTHLEQQAPRPAARGLGGQRPEQPRPDAPALRGGRDRDRLDVGLGTGDEQPGVAGQDGGAGRSDRLRHHVPPGRPRGELGPERGRRP